MADTIPVKGIMETGLAITSMAVFIQFIYEEALQTMSLGAYTLITSKEWAGAEELLDDVEHLNEEFKWAIDNIGKFAPQTWGAYHAYYNAVKKQVFAYRRMLLKHTADIAAERGARLYITSTPGGAKIYLNQEPTGETTPYGFTSLTPGIYEVRCDLYDILTGTIKSGIGRAVLDVGGRESIDVDLTPGGIPKAWPVEVYTGAQLYVASIPGRARIYLNQKLIEKTTPYGFKNLTPGTYEVRCRLDDIFMKTILSGTASAVLKEGQQEAVYIRLIPEGIDRTGLDEEYRGGELYVTSTPTGAEIYLNQIATGETTPHGFTNMTPGIYEIRCDRYDVYAGTVQSNTASTVLEEGQRESIHVDLIPEPDGTT